MSDRSRWALKFLKSHLDLYKSFKMRAFCGLRNSECIAIVAVILLDYKSCEAHNTELWSSESALVLDSQGNHGIWDLVKIVLNRETRNFGDVLLNFYGEKKDFSWVPRKYDTAQRISRRVPDLPTIVLESSKTLDKKWDVSRVLFEINHHDIEPFDGFEELGHDYDLRMDNRPSQSRLRILIPIPGKIKHIGLVENRLEFRGAILGSIAAESKLCVTGHWRDGHIQRYSFKLNTAKGLNDEVRMWEIRWEPPSKRPLDNLHSVNAVLIGPHEMTLHSSHFDISPKASTSWTILKALDDLKMEGEIMTRWGTGMMDSVTKQMQFFEYYISSLLNGLGIPTVWLGPYDLEGADLLAFMPGTSNAVAIEATLGTVRKKTSKALMALETFRNLNLDMSLSAVVFTPRKVSETDRKDLTVDGISVVDSSDFRKLEEIAESGGGAQDVFDIIMKPTQTGISF